MGTERIPEEVLEAAAFKGCRRLAATLITAMAETGTGYELIEKRTRKRRGWARKLIDRLITTSGSDVHLDDVSDFLFACGGMELIFELEQRPRRRARAALLEPRP